VNKKIEKFDYIIIGAGIVGLSIAKALIAKNIDTHILIMEKEPDIGLHSSGRNSGVLHSGIYYSSGSLKAKVCASGAKKMAAYCEKYQLPIQRVGKVIVPFKTDQNEQLETLYSRARINGARVELIDQIQLAEIEPEAFSATGRAIYSPDTCVVDPLKILVKLRSQLEASGVTFCYQADISKGCIEHSYSRIELGNRCYQYKFLYNASGLFADKIAKKFNAAKNYTMMPFKGRYYRLSSASKLNFNGLIYPVPDLNVPFLGVHSVKTIDGLVYFGPSALPAWGRENYNGLRGGNLDDSSQMAKNLSRLLIGNHDSFRNYFFEEAEKLTKKGFCKAIQKIIPAIEEKYLQSCSKVGIRAQLLNTSSLTLEMDYIVERVDNTIHILNAVSPAFTSAFEFSEQIVDGNV